MSRLEDLRQKLPPISEWACETCPACDSDAFKTDDDTGSYRCFSCGERGDHFAWWMVKNRISYLEAVGQLEKRYGSLSDR